MSITVSFGVARLPEDGPARFTCIFRRTGDISAPLTINYRVSGTAVEGTDFTTKATKAATFPAGRSAVGVVFDPTTDSALEPDETIRVDVIGYQVGTPSFAVATIANDEAPPPPPPLAFVYLSDRNPSAATNEWGPFERDRANGEQGAGDGGPLRINGTAYTKGLGVHAPSSLTYQLNGLYARFQCVIGLDDYTPDAMGSVIFRVLADGVERFTSGAMNGASPAQTIDLDISNAQTLQLVADANGSPASDHADWADARLAYISTSPIPAMPPFFLGSTPVTPAMPGGTPPTEPTPPAPPSSLENTRGWQLTPAMVGLQGAGVTTGMLTPYTGPEVIPPGTYTRMLFTRPYHTVYLGETTFRECLFRPTSYSPGTGVLTGINWRGDFSRQRGQCIIEDCEFDGSLIGTNEQIGFSTPLVLCAIIRRCYIHDWGSGIAFYNTGRDFNCIAEHNYIHRMISNSSNHVSPITIRDFPNSLNPLRSCLIKDNYSHLDTTNASSSLFIQTQVNNVNNVTIQGNYLRGRGYNLVLSQDFNRFPYTYSNIVATNNRFTPESFGAVSIDGGSGFASFTNNFIYSPSASDNRGAPVLV